jgi:hypothetical protein
MRALLDQYPEAIIRTCKQVYKGREDFDDKAPSVAYDKAGSLHNPQNYGEQCDC